MDKFAATCRECLLIIGFRLETDNSMQRADRPIIIISQGTECFSDMQLNRVNVTERELLSVINKNVE